MGNREPQRFREDPRPGLIVARLKNIKSGAVVSVSDEKSERLGPEWETIQDKKPSKPSPKSTKK